MTAPLAILPPEYVAKLVEMATRQVSAARKAINKKRYTRRYARIGKALREGRKP